MGNRMRKREKWFILLLSGVLLAEVLGLTTCSSDFSSNPKRKTSEKEVVVIAELRASASETVINGEAVRIWARLADALNQPVAGRVVQFATDLGSITPADTTDSDGIAEATFLPGSKPGTATITASYGSKYSRTVTVRVDSIMTQNLLLEIRRTSILGDGIDSAVVRVFLRNSDGSGIGGVAVRFESDAGRFRHPRLFTDSTGVVTNMFLAYPSRQDSLATLRCTALGMVRQGQILIRGIEFQLTANPTYLIADGSSQAKITAVLKETTSKVAIPNRPIIFATDLGTIPYRAFTNEEGRADVMLTSGTRTGTAHVVAYYGAGLRDTVTVDFLESQPAYLQVTVNPKVLPADHQSKAEIRAYVTDQSNNPVPDGTPVAFTIIEGSGTIESRKLTQNGVAVNELISGNRPDTTQVEVSVGGLRDTVTVIYTVGEPAVLVLTADTTALPADGITTTRIYARVEDISGNPVQDGFTVQFEASVGNITPEAVTRNGVAVAQFSSDKTGVAVITARAGELSDEITLSLLPGPPATLLLSFDPKSLGVKDSGRNQSVRVIAEVRDAKNNTVQDGTLVKFSIYSSPGGGETLSSTDPVPTVNGKAEVSLLSGIRSGPVRIQAEVVDASGQPVVPAIRAISTEIMIFAGPPYIEDVNDPTTSHLTVGTNPLNILGWNIVNNTATVVAVVGDKYNNPVPPGTAVYFTTTGGVISTHTGYTNEEGVAKVTIHTGQPYPTIYRYYHTFYDPNANHPNFRLPTAIIPGPIPDFEGGKVLNSQGNYGENDGIVRILAWTEGVDSSGNKAAVWAVTNLVFSGPIAHFTATVSDTSIAPGESVHIQIEVYDVNGNPIVAGSTISAESSAGSLSWTSFVTSDPGQTVYDLYLTNDLDPTDPNARETSTRVTIKITSDNGNAVLSTPSIRLRLR